MRTEQILTSLTTPLTAPAYPYPSIRCSAGASASWPRSP